MKKNDYEQWKEWLDKWNIPYMEMEEVRQLTRVKELIVEGNNWDATSIVFTLNNEFICMTTYE